MADTDPLITLPPAEGLNPRPHDGWQQLRLLLWKNYLLKKRRLWSTLAEIIIPVFMMTIVVIGWDQSGTKNYDDRSFLERQSPLMTFDEYASVLQLTGESYLLAVAPNTAESQAFVEYMSSKHETFDDVFYGVFETEQDLIDYAKATEEKTEELWAGVVFNDASPNWSYTIRMNSTELPDTRQLQDELHVVPTGWEDNNRNVDFDTDDYLLSGFATLQHEVHSFILQTEAPDAADADISPSFVPYPIPGYKATEFYDALRGIFGLFLALAYIWPVSRLVKNIVEEKETKIKEGMKIMGLFSWAFYASWAITYMIIFALSSVLVASLMSPTIFSHCAPSLIFFSFLLFSFSVMAFSFLLSVFFSRAKVAATAAPLLFLASTMPPSAFDENSGASGKIATSLFLSPSAFSFAMDILIDYESGNLGIDYGNINSGDFSFGTALLCMLFALVFYIVLAWYLEQVLPSEYGTHRHPLFLFDREYWRSGSDGSRSPLRSFVQADNSKRPASNPAIQQVSSELQGLGRVEIRDLRKVYQTNDGDKVAVDHLDLTFYEGQITALLGHNGAGKTTTIGMLTGLFPPTSGDCTVYGNSVVHDMQTIRQSLGICPQHDILFPDLTVEEHLYLFAALKGVPKADTASAVATKIEEVGLKDKTHTFSRALSGGMKRKLSVAIALIGDPKVVYLDEPTSGMDPYSRRDTWALLQRYKEGKVVVLTTHFMDEADLLGDRIAIMAKGNLQCVGSSLFLKARYGVGYNLTAVKDTSVYNHDQFTQMIKSNVSGAVVLSNVGAEVAFQLPLNAVDGFAKLFRKLDSDKASLGIVNYGISVTTLEEVFMKLAHGTGSDFEQQMQDRTKSRELSLKRQSTDTSEIAKRRSLQIEQGSSGALPAQGAPAAAMGAVHKASPDAPIFVRHFMAMLTKRYVIGKRDRKAVFYQIIAPVLVIVLAMALLSITINDAPELVLTPMKYDSQHVVINSEQSGEPQLSFPEDWLEVEDGQSPAAMNELLEVLWDNMVRPATPTAFVIDGTSPTEYAMFHNATYYHAIPAATAVYDEALIRALSGNPEVSITAAVHVFPLTDRQRDFIDSILALIASVFVLLPFSFISACFAVFVVKEREIKAKHIQTVSGINLAAYWLATFVWDMLNYTVAVVGTIIVFFIFDRTEFIGSADAFFATLVLFVLYGAAVVPFTYCWSFVFNNHSSAQNIMLMINFVAGFVTVQANYILGVIESTKDINDVLVFFYRLLPPFCLGEGITNLSGLDLQNLFRGEDEQLKPFDMDVLGWPLLYLAIETFVFLALAIFIDKYPGLFKASDPAVAHLSEPEDEDVIQERMRVERGDASDDIIVVEHLRKVYPGKAGIKTPKVAVHDLSFGIPAGECYGFLGVNGAGKTTTLSILSGDYLPTSGTARLAGHDVVTELEAVRRQIGYCPQFDTVFELMTGREHLEMYARIRGIPESEINQVVDNLISELDLTQYASKTAGGYSGGNKRKLSVAIALIGDPAIVFLDEPSTGMDPVARRFMWDAISRTMAGRSCILTTHSMEEAEALCGRICIMVGGRMRCLGSAQRLKDRYGETFQMELVSEASKSTEVQAHIEKTFAGARLLEHHGGTCRYEVPKQSMSLADVFETLQECKERLGIQEYSASQVTLEQIFLLKAGAESEEI